MMKKILLIIVLSLFFCSNSFADSNEIKKMLNSENYNLGIKKGDTTING